MTTLLAWRVVGFLGQGVFTARFLVQWLASERQRDSVIPVAFWWLSLVGGLTLLLYAVHQGDPVFILGQGMGMVVYVRNLMLVAKKRRRATRDAARAEARQLAGPHRKPEARPEPVDAGDE